MSLQGTLDTFGLHDVLALLSSTKKKGELKISGPDFTGSVWMDEGKLVGAEVPRCPTLVDAVFELLRLPNGEFSFEADSAVRVPMSAQAIGDVLSDAEDRMIEWRDICIHIPSVHTKFAVLAGRVGPRPVAAGGRVRAGSFPGRVVGGPGNRRIRDLPHRQVPGGKRLRGGRAGGCAGCGARPGPS
ncbi:MAG: DUF4388 domain-containing protein [Actinobacteria bacterium]|nr:DUF4388 domain-containing protein [Actinomycetota bacterium]